MDIRWDSCPYLCSRNYYGDQMKRDNKRAQLLNKTIDTIQQARQYIWDNKLFNADRELGELLVELEVQRAELWPDEEDRVCALNGTCDHPDHYPLCNDCPATIELRETMQDLEENWKQLQAIRGLNQ